MMTLTCGTQNMAQMNLFMRQKQAHTQREQTGVADGEGSGRERLGVWDQQMSIPILKTDKQGPTAQHSNYTQYPVINHNGKYR